MTPQEIYKELRKPFEARFVSWKINNYSKDGLSAQITFHIDARAVQNKLNEVVGLDGWSFLYEEGRGGSVHGKLTVRAGERDVIREDVGYPNSDNSQHPDKDAVSDALKRCAVHFGVGQFLYALPNKWVKLTESKQRYLTKEQDAEIKAWLTPLLERMANL